MTKVPGRPRSCDTGDVIRVLGELVREGREMLTVATRDDDGGFRRGVWVSPLARRGLTPGRSV